MDFSKNIDGNKFNVRRKSDRNNNVGIRRMPKCEDYKGVGLENRQYDCVDVEDEQNNFVNVDEEYDYYIKVEDDQYNFVKVEDVQYKVEDERYNVVNVEDDQSIVEVHYDTAKMENDQDNIVQEEDEPYDIVYDHHRIIGLEDKYNSIEIEEYNNIQADDLINKMATISTAKSQDKKKTVVCSECNKQFTLKKNLYAHQRKIHKFIEDRDPAIKKIKGNEVCSSCDKTFASKSTLRRHVENIHRVNGMKIKREYKRRLICPVENCSQKFYHNHLLREHLTNVHNIELLLKEIKFNSKNEFESWKRKTESRSSSSYVLHTSMNTLSDGTQKKFYNCHRSHHYRKFGQNIRSLKSSGSNKIGTACPSRIEVLENQNSIAVKFWKTHVGHSIDIERIYLSKETRMEIARKLKDGVSFQNILDEIRNLGIDDEGLQRLRLLKRRDLHNIARNFNIAVARS
ncbi:zinc finger protein 800-like [Centruroides vittatus]|uniref:zinc finger protein 800-like n=1 Tax=Centruroides vittatus TaxID=120091 RepID=UPI00351091E4